MASVIGCDKLFILNLVCGKESDSMLMMRYGTIASELVSVLDKATDLLPQEAVVLGGLMKNRQILGLVADDIRCRRTGELLSLDDRYLSVAICCDKRFVYDTDISEHDRTVFLENGVEIQRSPVVTPFHDRNSGNIIRNWALTDGGAIQAKDVFIHHISAASSITIYDRYYNSKTNEVVRDLFAELCLSNQSKLEMNIEILIGAGNQGLGVADIISSMSPYFDDIALIKVSTCSRKMGNLHLHDRYIQVDSSFTFVLTSGLSSFIESNGKNRASSVVLCDLFISKSNASLVRGDGTEVVISW